MSAHSDAASPGDKPASVPQKQSESWFELFRAKLYDQAVVALYAEGAREKTERWITEVLVGHVLIQKKRSEGVAHYERLFQEMPTVAGPYQWLAMAQINWGRSEAALQTTERALAAGVPPAEVIPTRARALKAMGRLDDGVHALEELAASEADAPEPLVALADLVQNTERQNERKNYLSRALQRSGDLEPALSRLASLVSADGEHDHAIALYRRLVKIRPADANYWTLLGNEYLALDLNDSAMASYEHANDLAAGKEAWILANIGNLLWSRGLFQGAIRYLRQAITIDDSSAYAHERLGSALQGAAAEEERANALVRALEAKPRALAAD